MDIEAILTALAAQGVTAIVKADAERMAAGTSPWTFVASGEHLNGQFVRIDAATVDACFAQALPRLRDLGVTVPDCLVRPRPNRH